MKQGTYKLTRTDLDGSTYESYIYIREKGALIITLDQDRASMTFSDKPIRNFTETFTSVTNISIYDFEKKYREVLKKTDELLGHKGVLIKPNELNSRLTVDHRDKIVIKY